MWRYLLLLCAVLFSILPSNADEGVAICTLMRDPEDGWPVHYVLDVNIVKDKNRLTITNDGSVKFVDTSLFAGDEYIDRWVGLSQGSTTMAFKVIRKYDSYPLDKFLITGTAILDESYYLDLVSLVYCTVHAK